MLRKMLGGSAEERRIAIPGARGALDWFAPIGQPNRVGQLKRASGRRCDHVPCWAERERERERDTTWSTSSFTSYHGQLLSLAVQWGVAIEIERAIKKSASF